MEGLKKKNVMSLTFLIWTEGEHHLRTCLTRVSVQTGPAVLKASHPQTFLGRIVPA